LTAVRAQAEPFLQALFGDFCQRGFQGFIEIRVIGVDGVQSRYFRSIAAVLDALPGLAYANSCGRNVYLGVSPRCLERGLEEDVAYVVALHTDVDSENSSQLDAAELSKRAGITPSIVVASGHGLHLYWLLQEPLHVRDADVRARARGVNAALAAALGGDHCHDLGRVLRLPGFANSKYKDQPIVKLLLADPQRRYTLDQFDFLHPTPTPSAKSSSAAKFNFASMRRNTPTSSPIMATPSPFHPSRKSAASLTRAVR